jgi:hypothetical protein
MAFATRVARPRCVQRRSASSPDIAVAGASTGFHGCAALRASDVISRRSTSATWTCTWGISTARRCARMGMPRLRGRRVGSADRDMAATRCGGAVVESQGRRGAFRPHGANDAAAPTGLGRDRSADLHWQDGRTLSRMESEVCPGRGEIVVIGAVLAATFWGEPLVRWQQLEDGRWLALEMPSLIPIHECRYGGGGGTAGDRAPLPSTPPARSRSAEQDLPSN